MLFAVWGMDGGAATVVMGREDWRWAGPWRGVGVDGRGRWIRKY